MTGIDFVLLDVQLLWEAADLDISSSALFTGAVETGNAVLVECDTP